MICGDGTYQHAAWCRGVDDEEALATDRPDYPGNDLRESLLDVPVRRGWLLVTAYIS